MAPQEAAAHTGPACSSDIDALVLLDGATGSLITKDGRSAIMEDPTGADFPWTPPTLSELLGVEVVGRHAGLREHARPVVEEDVGEQEEAEAGRDEDPVGSRA